MKRHCSTKWIEHYDAVFVFKEFYPSFVGSVFVFKEFYPSFVGSFDQLPESRDGKVLGKAMLYLKAITTAGFLVSLEVISATLKLTKTVAKKLQGIEKLF